MGAQSQIELNCDSNLRFTTLSNGGIGELPEFSML